MTYPLTYMYLLSFISALICAILIGIATPPQHSKKYLVVGGVLVSLWALGDLLSNLAQTPLELKLIVFVSVFVWSALPFAGLLGALVYSGYSKMVHSVPFVLMLLLPTAGNIYLVLSGVLYVDYVPAGQDSSYFCLVPTRWHIYSNLYHFVYAATAGTVIVRALRMRSVLRRRSTSRMLLFVMLPVVIIGVLLNGVLPLFGIVPPMVASFLLSGFWLYLTSGMLRRVFFLPLNVIARERDKAWDSLTKREEILSSIPSGVAIVEPGSYSILYLNPVFRKIVGDLPDRKLPADLVEYLSTRDTTVVQTDEITLAHNQGACMMLYACPVTYSETDAVLLTLRDISAQKAVEQELIEKREQLFQAQKMEAIGRLSAGVAHDFNNQLATILNYATFIGENLEPGSDMGEDVSEIIKAVKRARALTRQLLAFGRKNVAKRQTVNVSELLLKVEKMLSRMLGSDVELTVKLAERPAWTKADRIQLEQIFINLATNAREAMPDGGSLVFEVMDAVALENRTDGSFFVVQVTDSGCGIEEDVIGHVFEPFFTTKGAHGTGLGLSTTYGIVKQLGGDIGVESTVGKGTTFSISLPRLSDEELFEAAQRPTPLPDVASILWKNKGTVLVVDDEGPLRQAVRRMLVRDGFDVVDARDGLEAAKIFESNPYAINLLLTDLTMPGINGADLATRLLLIRPDLPVLFMSGHIGSVKSLTHKTAPFINKPFDRDELMVKISEVMSAAAMEAKGHSDSGPSLQNVLLDK